MNDEMTAANPAGEGEVASDEVVTLPNPLEAQTEEVATEAPTVEAEPQDDLDSLIGLDDNPEPELVDVEYDGETFKLPPKVKDALLRQSDYTRKTMEVAEQRKALEAKQAEIAQVANRSQEEFQAAVVLHDLNNKIAQYERANVEGWSQEDINAARLDLQDLTRQRDQINYALQQHVSERQTTQSQELAKLRQQTIERAAKEIPNFNDQRRAELESVAVALGIPEADAQDIYDPAIYKVLHYADIGRRFADSQRKKAQAQKAQAAKPLTTVGGAAESAKAASEMSMAEYIAARKSGQI